MKFFQQLLIAPAALGLLAPMAATANEAILDNVATEDLSAGQFSDYETSTKVTAKVTFNTGAVNFDDDVTASGTRMGNKLTSGYVSTFNVNTSFTGEDRLYARIKTGNMDNTHWENTSYGTHLAAAKNSPNGLEVDKLWYEFPVGAFKVWFGPRIEGYYMLASAPSIYKPVLKSHALGGNGAIYGSSTSPGFGAAWIQDTDSPSDFRWAISSNLHARGGDASTTGLMTDESNSKWLSKLEYGSPRMQVSVAYARHHCGTSGGCYDWASYNSTAAADNIESNSDGVGIRAYWKPEETGLMPSIQVGYDKSDMKNVTVDGNANGTSAWFTGFTWKDAFQDGNRLAAAIAAPTTASSLSNAPGDGAESGLTWEVYYDYAINDGVTITPALYGASDRVDGAATGHDDYFGALIQTTFKF